MWISSVLSFAVLLAHVYSAPQFITMKDGKLGVNFGGYHAAVGIGGVVDRGAGGGGLYAEAGTPHGQSARAGLGGMVGENGPAGGLYAGATAGGNVKAQAGLAGKVASENAAGNGFASAQAGHHYAESGLGGETYVGGSSGVLFSGTKSIGGPTTVVKDTELSFVPLQSGEHKKVHTEFNLDALNEVDAKAQAEVNVNTQPAVIVKEVYVEPKTHVVEKHIIHTHSKPQREEFYNTAYLGGFIGSAADASQSSIHKTLQPALEKRVDIGEAGSNVGGAVTYNKEVTVSRNPTFFQDIFNIPISALKAVSSFLSNTAGSTNVSVQKSASIHADSDTISPKHASSSTSSSSEAQVLIQTPSASQLVDDIFAIPINTLGAVNKFLENNVPARKRVQVSEHEIAESPRIRRGPHGRRRANKRVVIVEENLEKAE